MKTKKQKRKSLHSCHEVQIHYKRPLFDKEKKIRNSKDADRILREFIDLDRIDLKEFFFVILLTNANQVLGISEVSIGSSRGVVTNYKEILQLALLSNAVNILVAHNHPSGNLNPSQSDKNVTNELKKVLKIVDISLMDHIILSSEGYYSFTDELLL